MENFKYYTLFGVGISTNSDMMPTFERDFLYRWTSHEKEKAELAQEMINNEMFKTNRKEAVKAVGLEIDAAILGAIKIRMVHQGGLTAHLFVTDEMLDDEWIKTIIDSANSSGYGKKVLAESKIKL